jgi:hypothetical protein
MDEQQERRTSNIKLYEDVAELKADVKYIIKAIDELKDDKKSIAQRLEDKCLDCQPAKDLKSHIQDDKDNKKWTWDRVVFSITSGIALVGVLLMLVFGIMNIDLERQNPTVHKTSQIK